MPAALLGLFEIILGRFKPSVMPMDPCAKDQVDLGKHTNRFSGVLPFIFFLLSKPIFRAHLHSKLNLNVRQVLGQVYMAGYTFIPPAGME